MNNRTRISFFLLIFSLIVTEYSLIECREHINLVTGYVYKHYAEMRLLQAASQGDIDNVKYYLEKGKADINTRSWATLKGMTPLVHATVNGHHEVVKYLLKQNPTPLTKTFIPNGKPTHILEHAIYHDTIHTAFTILLWGQPEDQDIDRAMGILNKFTDNPHKYKLTNMLCDFQGFVQNNRKTLPLELVRQLKEKDQAPSLQIIDNGCGMGTIYPH